MITIDLRDKRPIYLQVIEGIEDLTIKGVLSPDEQLPSVRNLAVELSINPNTIQRAYLELEKRGTIYSIKGRGSFISPNNSALTEAKRKELYEDMADKVAEAKLLGISRDEFVAKVIRLYNAGKEGAEDD
ncbi:MAG: GntR family transcriptional regulator [Bacillota bacterium]|nr:GntR family transcriptional regulator [Bacillota bacterium]